MYINIDFQSIHYIEREIGNHSDTCVLDERRVSMENTVTVSNHMAISHADGVSTSPSYSCKMTDSVNIIRLLT